MAWSTKNKRGRPPAQPPVKDPYDRVESRRQLFAWLRPDERKKKKTERDGTIDQDVCDGIGQLCALGKLDADGYHAIDLRDAGRNWRNHLLGLLAGSATKVSRFERSDKSHSEPTYTKWDEKFDELDTALRMGSFERWALYSLLIDPERGTRPDGHADAPWVRAHVAYGLIERHKVIPHWMQPVRFPDAHDHDLLAAAIRGLCILAGEPQQRKLAA